jgi:hypothetical protein
VTRELDRVERNAVVCLGTVHPGLALYFHKARSKVAFRRSHPPLHAGPPGLGLQQHYEGVVGGEIPKQLIQKNIQ